MRMTTLALFILGVAGCGSGNTSPGALERYQRFSGLFRQLSQSNATVSRDSRSVQRALAAGVGNRIVFGANKTGRDCSRLARLSARMEAVLAGLPRSGNDGIAQLYFALVKQSVHEQNSEAASLLEAMTVLRTDPFLLDVRHAARFSLEYTDASQSAHRAVVLATRAATWKDQHAPSFRFASGG